MKWQRKKESKKESGKKHIEIEKKKIVYVWSKTRQGASGDGIFPSLKLRLARHLTYVELINPFVTHSILCVVELTFHLANEINEQSV